ncbi:hypothetical protein [Pseudorhodoferax sp. Leaf267]|uniref:hypothetical protein n=1 Tax=Pseudorhodoferax sp. Leaf267 TaxID=1736316 RepID=UPI0006F9807C|nr:hypothetical protein [Pseudorhodoferax sp. Leaf267]KQP21771.1 hypothetical protein ASF43_26085 [Pseudorhodoferax sp. Leaf267]
MATPARPEAWRGLAVVLLALACALGAGLWAGRGEFASHRAHLFGGAQARIALDYATLSAGLDEAALQQRLAGAPLRCTNTAEARICEADLARADGLPAARLRATLQGGRLQQTEVFLPWWRHHQAARTLAATLGAPSAYDTDAPAPGIAPGIVWAFEQGALRIARDPGWNPWRWSVLRWTATARP